MKRVIHVVLGSLLCCAMFATSARAQTVAPCCTVTQQVQSTNVWSAKVNSTGQTFTFALSATGQITQGGRKVVSYPAISVGQAIYANLSAKQISLDGKSPAGTITAISAAPAPATQSPLSATNRTAVAPLATAAAGKLGTATPTATTPAPCSMPNTWAPNTPDSYPKAAAVAIETCFVAACGASASISGNAFPAGTNDYLTFSVPASRANCANPVVNASISSTPPASICLNIWVNTNGTQPNLAFGSSLPTQASVGLGTPHSPLQPGTYWIKVGSCSGTTTGTWTLKFMG
jgi:hypothetical protein